MLPKEGQSLIKNGLNPIEMKGVKESLYFARLKENELMRTCLIWWVMPANFISEHIEDILRMETAVINRQSL